MKKIKEKSSKIDRKNQKKNRNKNRKVLEKTKRKKENSWKAKKTLQIWKIKEKPTKT